MIIGKNTGKLLHIGARNKIQYRLCTRPCQGHTIHACYRNWDKSSSEMESDIILEGFCQAGLRVIGDGDSSVHTTLLLQQVPGCGQDIVKLECANHACKCWGGGGGAWRSWCQRTPHTNGRVGSHSKYESVLRVLQNVLSRREVKNLTGKNAIRLQC